MHKQDYALIAQTIKTEREAIQERLHKAMDGGTHVHLSGMLDGYGKLAFALAEAFAKGNPRFSPAKFICDSGVK